MDLYLSSPSFLNCLVLKLVQGGLYFFFFVTCKKKSRNLNSSSRRYFIDMYNIRLYSIIDVYCDHTVRLLHRRFKENSIHVLIGEINTLHLNFFFLVFWELIELEVSEIDDKMLISCRNI